MEEAVTKVVGDGLKTINPNSLSNVTDASAVVADMTKTAMSRGLETVNGFTKGQQIARSSTDHNDLHSEKQPIVFTCPNPNCRRPLKVDAKFAGKKAKCNNCQTVVTIPEVSVLPSVEVQPHKPTSVHTPEPPVSATTSVVVATTSIETFYGVM